MNKNSRTKNVYINTTVSVSMQIFMLVLNFVSRIVFIKAFGESYLGINGLYSNIISVFSLADLGIGGAIIYSMYLPISQGDEQKITALLNFYKSCYRVIGITVCIIGLSLVPFLKYLVKLETNIDHITLYYLLFLADSVASYFFVYKTSIFNADQKNYKLKMYKSIFCTIKFILQLFVVLYLKNFTVYLLVQVAFSISFNYFCSKKAEKEYPYIKNKNIKLDKSEKKTIWQDIKSMMTYQIGGVLLNNTDNIFISVLVGTVMVGFYSNYIMIVSSVNIFVVLVFNSIQSSVGNLAATESSEKQYKIFKVLQLLSFWLYGFCSICIYILSQDFISICFGASYKLSNIVLAVVVLNFYIMGILYPVYCYRNTVGLFKQTKNVMLFTCLINLVLSIILGKYFGLVGILAATGLSRLATNHWYEPLKLYTVYFNKKIRYYYFKQCYYILVLFTNTVLILFIIENIALENILLLFVIKGLLCVIIPNAVFILLFRKTNEFKYIINSFRNILHLRGHNI